MVLQSTTLDLMIDASLATPGEKPNTDDGSRSTARANVLMQLWRLVVLLPMLLDMAAAVTIECMSLAEQNYTDRLMIANLLGCGLAKDGGVGGGGCVGKFKIQGNLVTISMIFGK